MVNPVKRISAANLRAGRLKHMSNNLLKEGMGLLADIQAANTRNFVRSLAKGGRLRKRK